jgi:hypothetical protein
MFKKATLLVLLAAAAFATPVSVGFDNPIPMCYPCPGDR